MTNRGSMIGSGGQYDLGNTITKFEFGKYSTLDDTPKNLVVTSDKDSGAIVLWHQDCHISKKDGDHSRVSKFIMSLIPRVVLTPSIT